MAATAAVIRWRCEQLKALPPQASCGDGDGGAEAGRAKLAAEFEGFLGELSGPGSQGSSSLIEAAEDQLRRYGPRPATLVLAIDADGASLVKRSNLGTMFGAESTTVSSGIVGGWGRTAMTTAQTAIVIHGINSAMKVLRLNRFAARSVHAR